MPEFKRNRPKRYPYIPTIEQCCVPVPDANCWTDNYRQRRIRKIQHKHWDIEKCGRAANIEIDGEHYCTQHAAIYALACMLREEVDFSQPYDAELREELHDNR